MSKKIDIVFSSAAWSDYLYWRKTDKKRLKKINELIQDISRHPFSGKGKPEPLKFILSDFWSRRIDREHRLIYRISDGKLEVSQCCYHYHNKH